MASSDDQFIDDDPRSLRHANDTLAFVDQDAPPKLPPEIRAKWINESGEHEDTPGQMLATQNHQVIRIWAEARRAKPALLKASDPSDPIQALRFQVTDRRESEYELVEWDEWLGLFERANLVFVYQQRKQDGESSDMFRLVPASSVER